MKLSMALGGAVGLAIAIALAGYYGFAEIASGLGSAGWGVLAVIAFHPLRWCSRRSAGKRFCCRRRRCDCRAPSAFAGSARPSTICFP